MTNLESLTFFIPELVLLLTAMLLLLFALIRLGNGFYLSIIGILISLFFVFIQWESGSLPLFWGLLTLDKPALFFKVIFITTTLLVIVFSRHSRDLWPMNNTADAPEYYALLVGSLLGMNLLAQAGNILIIYLSLEFVSLTSYLLVGYVRGSERSSEAALKYILFGAVASGIFLYGASLFYGITGSLSINSIYQGPLISISGILMLAGFLYKIAAVPMHAWCPDAYEGAPIPITAFLSVAPKAAGFAVLMRVASVLGMDFGWPLMIAAISAVTMTFGNLAAIPQTNLKRLLAYSSIAHAGYLLMGVACNTQRGNEAVYFYFVAYLIMNLGAFLVVQIVAEELPDYAGLGRRGPYGAILGITMTIFLLSLTGIPPFVGFIGKFYLFSAVIDAKLYWLAIVGIVNSVISLYYYMRIVKAIFFDSVTGETAVPPVGKQLTAILILLALAAVILGLYWQPIANVVASIVR